MKINTNASRRRLVLDILSRNRGDQMPIDFADLRETMFKLGHSVTAEELRAALEYLAGRSQVRLIRKQDMPGFKLKDLESDERPDHIAFVKLTPDGVDAVEGV